MEFGGEDPERREREGVDPFPAISLDAADACPDRLVRPGLHGIFIRDPFTASPVSRTLDPKLRSGESRI